MLLEAVLNEDLVFDHDNKLLSPNVRREQQPPESFFHSIWHWLDFSQAEWPGQVDKQDSSLLKSIDGRRKREANGGDKNKELEVLFDSQKVESKGDGADSSAFRVYRHGDDEDDVGSGEFDVENEIEVRRSTSETQRSSSTTPNPPTTASESNSVERSEEFDERSCRAKQTTWSKLQCQADDVKQVGIDNVMDSNLFRINFIPIFRGTNDIEVRSIPTKRQKSIFCHRESGKSPTFALACDVYRISMTIKEPYREEFERREDEKFQKFAKNLTKTVEGILHQHLKKDHHVTFVKMENAPDPFESHVHLDVHTMSSEADIRDTLERHINTYYSLGKFTVNPLTFRLRAVLECQFGEIACDVSRCILQTQRCDFKADCEDGSDEAGCKYPSECIYMRLITQTQSGTIPFKLAQNCCFWHKIVWYLQPTHLSWLGTGNRHVKPVEKNYMRSARRAGFGDGEHSLLGILGQD
ncbi:hypothetical protein QAD02_008486 [Eretmocerus hayati]|uniref:Uncharacterized protein n=1 Tax=Eretmocerus hayati TaxID=131215 RepID=A0ACC2N6Y9_9HYME|nr:hypothetical protein QAD02_008486 [Eretmocerus hayati]